MKGVEFKFAKPTKQIEKNYDRNNIWLVTFDHVGDLNVVSISDSWLVDRNHLRSLSSDEKGPLSDEINELDSMKADLIQELIPEGTNVFTRTYAFPKHFFNKKYNFTKVGKQKEFLRETFTRYGINPDNIPDIVLTTKAENLPDEFLLFLDKDKRINNISYFLPIPENYLALKKILEVSSTVIFAQDTYITIFSKTISLNKIRASIEKVAKKYHLELPKDEYVLTVSPELLKLAS